MTSTMTSCDVGKLSGVKCDSIRVRDCVEVFQDYKRSAVMFSAISCDWKCCKEAGRDVCQNMKLTKGEIVVLSFDRALKMVKDSITDAVLFAGLEPLLQADELVQFIEYLRQKGISKPIVIYTGYYPEEINQETLLRLAKCQVVMKFGRYIPDRPSRFDEILGITLASDNQFGVEY